METIILKNLVTDSSSNDQGLVLFSILSKAYNNKQTVILDIDNNQSLSSSFLNSSVGEFLELYGLEAFKAHIKFKGSQSQFKKISTYLDSFSETYLV